MRRDEPGPTLPAWLQEQTVPDTAPTTRRGFRRTGRTPEPPESPGRTTDRPATGSSDSAAPPDPEPVPVASVPLGMVLAPTGTVPAEPEPVVPEDPATSPDLPEPPRPEPDESAERDAHEPGDEEPGELDAADDDRPSEPAPTDLPPASIPSPPPAPAYPLPLPDHQPSNLDLASGVLVRRSRLSSRRWRESVGKLTGGLLDTGTAARHEDLVARIRQPISGDYRIAVLSLKGGVGKTTTTVGLGSTFASLRGDCVIAVDANPDFGTLAQRIPQQTDSTVRDLLADAPNIRRYSDVRVHTSQAPSRLEVLASERDPAASEAFSEDDYRNVIDILQVFYNIILTDCGTGIMHSAMRGVLDLANALVLVASPAVDGARSAAATLDWLQAHGYRDLVERTVVVISSPRPGAANIDMDALVAHFLARCRAVEVLPFDEHLAEGAEIHLDRLRPATRRAFVALAAMVADDFPALSGRHAVK